MNLTACRNKKCLLKLECSLKHIVGNKKTFSENIIFQFTKTS